MSNIGREGIDLKARVTQKSFIHCQTWEVAAAQRCCQITFYRRLSHLNKEGKKI
jgi:hypothetical protein